jgi:zinc/manganese transport system substrate-binding protein
MTTAKSRLLAAAALMVGAAAGSPSTAAEPLKVVVSFSILGDLVANVGGDRVELTTLVGLDSDAHVYEPRPADARATAAADLVVVNGLGFEGWLERLIEASGYSGQVVVASTGVDPLTLADGGEEIQPAHVEGHHDHVGIDPHAWQSIANSELYVRNIRDALCVADASDCAYYQANAGRYLAGLRDLDASIRDAFRAVPKERRKVITTHDAFRYFAEAYEVTFLAPVGVSTDSEASAADVAKLVEQIRAEGVTALFVENVSDPRLIEQIARETGAAPGGELYSDALSEADGPASTYVAMMRHNAEALLSAMPGS